MTGDPVDLQTPAPRTPLNIPVLFRKNYSREESSAQLKNLSLTGAFLSHHLPLRAGEKIQMKVQVSGRIRDIHARVVWVNSAGCGVKFQPQNNQDVQILDDLIYFVEEKRTGTKSILSEIFKKVS